MPDIGDMIQNIGLRTLPLTVIPFVLLAFVGRRRVRQAMNWERTTGTVLFSMVETRRSSNGRGGRSTSYYPKVVYEYNVMGQRYQSDRFNLGEIGLGFYNRVASKVAEYPQGKQIDVYFNPNNPAEAVLERTSPSSKVMFFVVIFILALLACTTAMTMGGIAWVSQFIQNTMQNIPTR